VGGGVKAEHQDGGSETQGQKSSKSMEAKYFEATGGNTILASRYVSMLNVNYMKFY
jgi:hypothetical protein